jgi:long-subunit acyl-CoA synthetase (AMP-forming)
MWQSRSPPKGLPWLVIGFVSGSVANVPVDVKILMPSLLITVARIYSRFYDGIRAILKEKSGIARGLF